MAAPLPAHAAGPQPLSRGARALLVALAAGIGLATAFLVVGGTWQFAVVLIAALPAAVLLHRYPFAALLIWMLLTPFLVTVQTSVDRQVYWVIHRALPPAAVLVVVLSAAFGARKRRLPALGTAEWLMAGYVLVSLIGILLESRNPGAAAIHFYDRVPAPMFLYLLVRLLRPGEAQLKWLVPVALFIVVSQFAIGVLSWSFPQVLPSHWLNLAGVRTTGSLRHPTVYSTAMTFFGLTVLHAAQNRSRGGLRAVYIGTVVLSLVGVFMTFSRGSWLGGTLVILGLLILYPRVIAPVLAVCLVAGSLLLTGPFSPYLEYANERLSSTDSALSRLPVYYAAAQMVQAKPLFGWGYLNFDLYDREYQGRVGDLVNPEKDHTSHNEYLTILAEQGAVGLGLYLAPVLWWLGASIRALRRLPGDGFWSRKLLALFWLVVLHYLVVSSFSDIEVVYGMGLWWISLGFIGSIASEALEDAGHRPSPAAGWSAA